jgi:hypothetical protein
MGYGIWCSASPSCEAMGSMLTPALLLIDDLFLRKPPQASDVVIVTPLLDRLTQHGHLLKFEGKS